MLFSKEYFLLLKDAFIIPTRVTKIHIGCFLFFKFSLSYKNSDTVLVIEGGQQPCTRGELIMFHMRS